MQKYIYKAMDRSGSKRTGSFRAKDRSDAKQKMRLMKLRVLSLKVEKKNNKKTSEDESEILGSFIYKDGNGNIQISLGQDRPTQKNIIVFTKQFATMLKSGVPLIQSLGLLAEQQQSRTFMKELNNIRTSVENGSTLSNSMSEHPKTFDNLYVSMVRAGEQSGNLDKILFQLVGYQERALKIKQQIKSAMTYPTIVVVIAIGVIVALLTFVVPTMATNFESSGNELPELTQFVMNASDYFVENWILIIGGLVAFVISIVFWKKTKNGRMIFDHLLLTIPVIGAVMKKIAIGRFCNTMSSMLRSGVNLLEALVTCANSSGNKVIEKFILGIRSSVESGEKFSQPLRNGDLFPEMVVSMIAVGEESGQIDEMLEKISEFYDEEVDLAIKAMLTLIEPILIVGIGGIIAVIVLAMYLPMFEMAGNI